MEDVEREEYEEIRKRKTGIDNIFKSLSGWQLFSVFFLVSIFLYFLSQGNTNKFYYAMIIVSIATIVLYSQKQEGGGFISMENAKRIASEAIEKRKEELEIESGANIKTGFCLLEDDYNGKPYRWHVAVRILTDDMAKRNWRVDVHPFTGRVTAIADEKYNGTGPSSIKYTQPDYYYKEQD